jgi:hypothetical protein
VNAVGLTNLDKANYAWLGGTIRASFFLFPSTMNVDPALPHRLSFIGEFDWYDEVRTGNQSINMWRLLNTISRRWQLIDPASVYARNG